MGPPTAWASNSGGVSVNMYNSRPQHELHTQPSFTSDVYDAGAEKAGAYAASHHSTAQLVPSMSTTAMTTPAPPEEAPQEPTRWVIEPVDAGFWRIIQNFDFKWYGSTMGTGIVSILLFTLSETYPDAQSLLFSLSVFFFGLNIIFYTVILAATILRYVVYPKFFLMMISDPGQAMYLGTMPMGFATIITMTVNVVVPRSPGWATAAWAFWWVDVVISLACALGVPWLIQTRHHMITDLDKMTAGWLLPVVAPIVAAATGSAVASALPAGGDALVTILVSYVLVGTGLSTALMVIVIYYLRLTTFKLPPTEHMVSTFLPLGALGQGGFAFQQLGQQALRVFPVTGTLPAVVSAGDALLAGKMLFALGFVVAVVLWGFAMLWFLFAVLSVTRQRVPFSNGWWAFTFPLGVLATSTLAMGRNLPSVAFQTLGTIFAVVVMVMWVVVVVMLVVRMSTARKWAIFKAAEVTGPLNKLSV